MTSLPITRVGLLNAGFGYFIGSSVLGVDYYSIFAGVANTQALSISLLLALVLPLLDLPNHLIMFTLRSRVTRDQSKLFERIGVRAMTRPRMRMHYDSPFLADERAVMTGLVYIAATGPLVALKGMQLSFYLGGLSFVVAGYSIAIAAIIIASYERSVLKHRLQALMLLIDSERVMPNTYEGQFSQIRIFLKERNWQEADMFLDRILNVRSQGWETTLKATYSQSRGVLTLAGLSGETIAGSLHDGAEYIVRVKFQPNDSLRIWY